MKSKQKLYLAIIPVSSILATLSFLPTMSVKDDNVLCSNQATATTTPPAGPDVADPSDPTKPPAPEPITILPGKDIIDLNLLSPNQFEMDYAIYSIDQSNKEFQGINILSDYFRSNWNVIFKNMPIWEEPNITNTISIEVLNTGVHAKVVHQTKGEAPQVFYFRLYFAEPSVDKVIIKVRTILDKYKTSWPANWTETVVTQFYNEIRQGISTIISWNTNGFPQAIVKENASNLNNLPIQFNKSLFELGSDSILIQPNAIRLIPKQYDNVPPNLDYSIIKPITITTPIEVQKPVRKSFIEQNGWIVVILPVGILAFIILLSVYLGFTNKRIKKMHDMDSTWGFY